VIISMNERIKLLAEQAGWGKGETQDDCMQCSPFDKEKFAELIVAECRDIVEQDMKLAHIQMIPLTLEKYANGRLKEKIKEHFGVEE
jgi:hypothetical protein